MLASLAVMLCTAMVLITWSVMGGFLQTFIESGRKLSGDVSITWPNVGFGHYEELVKRLEAEGDVVAAATGVIETMGPVGLPDSKVEIVRVLGVDFAGFTRVVDFDQTIWWRPIDRPVPRDHEKRDPRLEPSRRTVLEAAYRRARSMTAPDMETGMERPALIAGIEVFRVSKRDPAGFYAAHSFGIAQPDGGVLNRRISVPDGQLQVSLTVARLGRQGQFVDTSVRSFPVANEFQSGRFDADSKLVIVPLSVLQQMMKMDEAASIDPASVGDAPGRSERDVNVGADGRESFEPARIVGVEPARVTQVLVRATEGVPADVLKARVRAVYEQFAKDFAGKVPTFRLLDDNRLIRTWQESNATLLGAVQKETTLVLSILVFISVTASFLILAIFWAMVAEKTKDIGVLRSLGASRQGVAAVWLLYGLAIGLLGSIAGGVLAYTIVTNINQIHEWMGRALGVQIWDPAVYYFVVIPNKVDPGRAAIVLGGGVLFSLFGALIPAIRAALMDPVRSLRFE